MALYYQTEYRLGRHAGTVRRSYRGLQAFLAIALDLMFVFTFELVFAALFFVLANLTNILKVVLFAILYLFTVPFRLARWVSDRFERGRAAAGLQRGRAHAQAGLGRSGRTLSLTPSPRDTDRITA